jgi:hypothetical protein
VADALNPNPEGDSPIQPQIISEADLADVELSDFDCIFICNVAQFTPDESVRLSRYTASGGGLVFFLGDRVVSESYNALAVGTQPLIPARLGEVVTEREFGIDPLEYRHAIVAPFRGRERAGLLTTPITRYFRLEAAANISGVEVAARSRAGDPLIVTAPFGRGRTVLIATDASLGSVDASTGEPWTIWPTWPSFLPIVQEVLAYAAGGEHQRGQQLVGTPIAYRSGGGIAERQPARNGTFKLERPDGKIVSMQRVDAGVNWSYGNTDLSGIYTLRGLPDNDARYFAINLDTAESDLRKVDPQQLPPEMRINESENNTRDAEGSADVSRAGWSDSLLWAALALIFVESFLAWQFGRGAA